MTREEWQRIKQLTANALERPAPARQAYVRQECADDPIIAQEVLSLLSSSESTPAYFETSVFRAPGAAQILADITHPHPTRTGTRIGAYRIVREIGRGGMGTVFLAERADDEYRHQVALKIVHDGRSPDAFRWFRDERQILATLDHPNIARLLDGGTTDDGFPYLVMEYVEGTPVDEYCAAHALKVRERLELFRDICRAVDYAHRNLVVHRDIKPRNILIKDGAPKLLDFGIAKLLDAGGSSVAAAGTGPSLLTPEYASPEQLKKEPITTAADVYALGVLLYWLLTARSPYRVSTDAPHELAMAICEQQPRRPSAVAETAAVRRRLAGDLDAIVLKALDKNPARRYSSAGSLADDIGRHLSGQAVDAREDGFLYRAGKFVLRHRLGVGAAAVVVLALVGGLMVTLWEARETERQRARAERHFDDVRGLASSLIFEINDSIQNVPGTVQTRELLVKRAVEYFDGLAAEETDNVGLQRELASAYDKLGDVLGRPYQSNLGDSAAALASYRKALAIRETISPDAGDRDSRSALWSSYYNVGNLLRETANTGGALDLHEKAYAVATGLSREAPQDPVAQRAVARTALTRAHTFVQAGHVTESAASAREAVAIAEAMLLREPGNGTLKADAATGHGRLGMALLKLGDRPNALSHLRQRLAITSELVAAAPTNVAARRSLSTAYLQVAQALVRMGDPQGAREAQQTAMDIRRQILAEDASDRQSQIDVMVAQLENGELLGRLGEHDRAAAQLHLAVEGAEALVAADPEYVFYQLSLMMALTRLAQTSVAQNHAPEAAPFARRAIELAEAASEKDPADARVRFERALAYATMGDAAGGLQSGRSWYQRSLDVLRELRTSGRLEGGTLNGDEADMLAIIERKLSTDTR